MPKPSRFSVSNKYKMLYGTLFQEIIETSFFNFLNVSSLSLIYFIVDMGYIVG